MGIYVIADTHFNHTKIIEYCDRPFNNVHEMNEHMIEQWNSVVTDDDVVYVLGDFGFGSVESLTRICTRLNGTKYLIMGNHDRRRSPHWWLKIGFTEVFKNPVHMCEIVLSHEPIDTDGINIHGHVHNNPISKDLDPHTHYCVSVECLDYSPMLLFPEPRCDKENDL